MTEPTLSEDDRLSLLVGRIVRASAELDRDLRTLGMGLLRAVPGPGLRTIEPDHARALFGHGTGWRPFGPLVTLLEDLLKETTLESVPRERVARLLAEARKAYEERSRVVHDPPLRVREEDRTEGGPSFLSHRHDVSGYPMEEVDPETLEVLVIRLTVLDRVGFTLGIDPTMSALEEPGVIGDHLRNMCAVFDAVFPRSAGA